MSEDHQPEITPASPENVTAESGGSGGSVALPAVLPHERIRTESGRTVIQDRRLEAMAIRRGWLKGQRWPTDATVEDFEAVEAQRPLTIREKAAKQVALALGDVDSRVNGIATKSALQMERQNQIDELAAAGQDANGGEAGNVNVNILIGGSADERRVRISAIAERLGVGSGPALVSDGTAAGDCGATGELQDAEGSGGSESP